MLQHKYTKLCYIITIDLLYITGYTMRKIYNTRMWANAQRDGRPAEYRWRSLFNAGKFG